MIVREIDVVSKSSIGKYHVLEYSADAFDVIEARKLNGGNEKRLQTIFFGEKADFDKKFKYALNATRQSFDTYRINKEYSATNYPLDRIEHLAHDKIPNGFAKDLLGASDLLFDLLKSKYGNESGKISRKELEEALSFSNVTTYKRASLQLGIKSDFIENLIASANKRKIIAKSFSELGLIDISLLREFIKTCRNDPSKENNAMILQHEYGVECQPELCYICRSFPAESKPNAASRYDIFYNLPICEMHSIKVRTSNAPHIPNDYTSTLICQLYPKVIDVSWGYKEASQPFKSAMW